MLGSLAIPLPIFNRRQGELESLEARRIQARAELLGLEKEIRKEVDQALNQWDGRSRIVSVVPERNHRAHGRKLQAS